MDFAFLFADWLGKPIWMWASFISIVIAILAFDLGVLHKENKEIEVKDSLKLSALYISLGLAFGGWVWWYLAPMPASTISPVSWSKRPWRSTTSSSSR